MRVRESMASRSMKFTEMFALLDSDRVGLVSFQAFLRNID